MAGSSADASSAAPFDGELGDLTPDKAAPAAPNAEFNLCTPDPGTMDAAKARYLAGALLDGTRTHYTKARLGTWAHCEESMEVFGEALARCPALTSVDLGDIVASRMEAEAVKTYKMLADKLAVHRGQLKALDFSYNAVGPTGLKALRGLLEEQESLEELVMVACGVSAETQEELSELLLFRDPETGSDGAAATPVMTKLRRIVFDNNLAGEGGAVAVGRVLRQSPELEEFQFSGARVPKEGGRALISALTSLPRTSLTRLDLHDNIFGSSCRVELAGLVSASATPALEDLNLSDLGIGDGATAELCRCLLGLAGGGGGRADGAEARCARLRQLRLGGNDVEQGGEAAPMLATLLVALPNLEELHVNDNELGSAVRWLGVGLAARARLASGAATLRVVDVGTNMAHPKALKAVVEAAMAAGGVESVEIGGNMVEEEDAAAWGGGSVAVTTASAELEPADQDDEDEAEAAFPGCSEADIPFLAELSCAAGTSDVDSLTMAVAGMTLASAAPASE